VEPCEVSKTILSIPYVEESVKLTPQPESKGIVRSVVIRAVGAAGIVKARFRVAIKVDSRRRVLTILYRESCF
jgi:predicted AAA+ superfamily ATPase